MSDLRGDHQGDCGLAIESRSWGYPGDSGHVTPGKGSWRWGHPGECGHVTSGAGSGRDLLW